MRVPVLRLLALLLMLAPLTGMPAGAEEASGAAVAGTAPSPAPSGPPEPARAARLVAAARPVAPRPTPPEAARPASPEVITPSVPASVSPRNAAAATQVSGVVQVRAGANNIFPVALGHMNRIITPFERAGVETSSGEEIQSRGAIIYLSPKSEAPVTMFLHEDGDDSTAISLTLVPRLIPPVELDLRLAGEGVRRVPARTVRERVEQAERWERGQPYVETIRDVMRRLAVGEVPPGYEMRQLGGAASPPPCHADAGITVDFQHGQLVAGAQLEAYVGVVRNRSPEPREFVESWCGSGTVAAVALAPSPMLAPGASAEIFIIVRAGLAQQERGTPRPSLLSVRDQR